MSHNFVFEYYYGIEAEQYTFYRIPKALITDPRFRMASEGNRMKL